MSEGKNKFVYLDDDSKDLLEADQNLHSAYIDLLTLLNDLLIPCGSEPLRPRFTYTEIMRELPNLVHAFSSGHRIGEIARNNINVASNLYSLSQPVSYDPKGKPTSVKKAVDSFLNDILKEYDLIRIIRSRGGVMRH